MSTPNNVKPKQCQLSTMLTLNNVNPKQYQPQTMSTPNNVNPKQCQPHLEGILCLEPQDNTFVWCHHMLFYIIVKWFKPLKISHRENFEILIINILVNKQTLHNREKKVNKKFGSSGIRNCIIFICMLRFFPRRTVAC